MQHLKEFLIRLQTFNLRITQQEVVVDASDFNNIKRRQGDAYDIAEETPYYDSFSLKSELRVLKDMALIDLLTLEHGLMDLQLKQLQKVLERIKQFWKNWHSRHSEWLQDYKNDYIFSIELDKLFIVYNLKSSSKDIGITGTFVEDLADSVKLRESFLRELIQDIEMRLNPPQPKMTFGEFKEFRGLPVEKNVSDGPLDEIQINAELPQSTTRYPTFASGIALQFHEVLKKYFVPEEHAKLKQLLLTNQIPETPLIFRSNGNQLADAFKQLYDANLIVGCQQVDLEKWLAPKFLYLSPKGKTSIFTEGYLNDLISTNLRPCKSPIIKIDQKEGKFLILPTSRNKK
ncbi:MAG: hypothetical protein JWR09_4692 [Mucilaginibacter sp.]|nr:hypothetical protein [Mucilaginibacter sp.]